MKFNTKNSLLILVLLVSSASFSQQSIVQSPIVPNPKKYMVIDGFFSFQDELRISEDSFNPELKDYYKNLLFQIYGIKLILTNDSPDVILRSVQNGEPNNYSINVNDKVRINYSTDESKLYALISLMQLIEKDEEGFKIKKSFVSDSPLFTWRGMHLDVSRHFFSVSEVKKILDLMAFYKLNKFHWHLTDDQGWRIEIKQFPKLTSIGAWRDSTVIGHANSLPHQYEKAKVGGFYTQEQIREIIHYASARSIEVIPEIEMPGHARAALAAYPEYSCTGIQHGVEGLWGVFDDIYCSKKESIDFNKKILDEVIELFPSKYIHIGGDEAPKTRWKSCEKCQKVIKDNHLHNEHELQSYFIKQIDQYVVSKGKKIIGWDEILEGGLSENAIVMSWRGEIGGIEAAKQKHEVIMSPSGYCYFDHYQSNSSTEPLAIGGFTTLSKVYEFNPIPKDLPKEYHSYILGGQANVWTEYITNDKHLEYMIFPRILAMAQVLWCSTKPNYDDFLNEVVNHQLNILSKLNVNVSKAILYPKINLFKTDKGIGLTINSVKENEVFDVEILKSTFLHKTKNQLLKLTQKDTLFFNRLSHKDKFENTILHIKSDNLKKSLRLEIINDKVIGLPIKFITQPSDKFNNRGELALVDGVRGTRPWKGDEWLGFDQDTIQFELDLLKIQKCKQVKIGFLNANGSWIYLPETVQVFYSKDGKNWKSSQKLKASEFLTLNSKLKCRFVKFEIVTNSKIKEGLPGEGFHPWTFIDEIEVK